MTTRSAPVLSGTGVFGSIRAWLGERPLEQIALLIGVVLLFTWLGNNATENMGARGMHPGFAYLSQPAGFEIGESLIGFSARDSHARAVLVGLITTIEVSFIGCVAATVLGVLVGVARLSVNPLLSFVTRTFIEIVRDTPILLQLFVWSAVLHELPPARQALNPVDSVYLSNRGVFLPGFADAAAPWWILATIAAVVIAGVILNRIQARRGALKTSRAALILAGASLLVPAIALASGVSPALDRPVLDGFNFEGGLTLSPEFAALLTGLVVYNTAIIAEIVRGGIQAVPRGQWEAARAMGLSAPRVLRLVVLPQAMRVILPVLTSAYLSLTKTSSLAVAIGFPDLVSVVNTQANVTGQAIETMGILVVCYLALSLFVSILMNLHNRRLAKTEGRT